MADSLVSQHIKDQQKSGAEGWSQGRMHGRTTPGSASVCERRRLAALLRWVPAVPRVGFLRSLLAGSSRRRRPKALARAPVRGVLAVPKVIGCTEGALCAEGDPMWRIRSTSATPVAMHRGASWRQSVQWHLAPKRKVVARRRACRALRHGDSRRSSS